MSNLTEDELLASFRPWLRATANRMTLDSQRSRMAEDVAAEGWIAIWRELQRLGGKADDAWLKRCAINKMIDVLKATGRARRDERRTVYVDDLTALWEATETIQDLDWAYHRGQLAQALEGLTERQRRYIELRFLHGWSSGELNDHFAMANSADLWRSARPKLAAALAHLAPQGWQPKVDGRSKAARQAKALASITDG